MKDRMGQVTTDNFPGFKRPRLESLDALRGFDMFWIIGGEFIFHGMARANGAPFWKFLSDQFTHPDWNGYHVYDQIFPLFLFLAGVSMPFSVGRDLEAGKGKGTLSLRIIKRGIILVLLGIFCNNGLQYRPLADIRFCSVLGRIGLAYMFAGLLYLYARRWAQYAWFAGFLIFYWLLLKFNSAPGFPAGDLSMPGNFASYLDRLIVPGKLYLGIHDPEGLLSTISAISTGLSGILAGIVLADKELTERARLWIILVAGAASLVLAQVWNLDFPINKNLWTSSFVLHTTGISLLLLALFYLVIDVWGYRKWAFFFRVIGVNSIMIYISSRFIQWDYLNNACFKWAGQLAGSPYGIVVMSFGFLAVKWMFLYFMYRKKVFLKV